MRNSAEDHVTVSSMGPKVSTSDHIKSKDHGKSSEKYVLSETVDDRKIVDDDDIATVSRSNIFAKSIEKVLAPSGTFKPSDATPNSMGGTNIQQKESSQLMSSESEMGDAQPGLKGHDVLWALQKAALEKAKRKQKSSKMNPRNMKAKQSLPLNDVDDWKNAKPISLRPEWALQMDDLEKRIEQLKCQTSLL
ncbi:hypothetical protein KP509_05G057000 [Ceratopteris richardii]|nr:hypothetical protein KP509_05G057000 [Ceratopteris richardii]